MRHQRWWGRWQDFTRYMHNIADRLPPYCILHMVATYILQSLSPVFVAKPYNQIQFCQNCVECQKQGRWRCNDLNCKIFPIGARQPCLEPFPRAKCLEPKRVVGGGLHPLLPYFSSLFKAIFLGGLFRCSTAALYVGWNCRCRECSAKRVAAWRVE